MLNVLMPRALMSVMSGYLVWAFSATLVWFTESQPTAAPLQQNELLSNVHDELDTAFIKCLYLAAYNHAGVLCSLTQMLSSYLQMMRSAMMVVEPAKLYFSLSICYRC